MIKVLHYCWFGGNPLPESAVKFMESWKKFCPDFEIKCWDESNFDVNSVQFVKQAYEAKKWAFVSDYVRTYALYEEGGLYVDTDVELIKSIDDLLGSSFMGFEASNIVNPGLILYANEIHHPFYKKVLDIYNSFQFSVENMFKMTSPKVYTNILIECGLKQDNSLQTICGVTVYPMEYFQPWGENWRKKIFSEKTRTIHHYDASWFTKEQKALFYLVKKHGKFFGSVFFVFRHPIVTLKKLRNKKKKREK